MEKVNLKGLDLSELQQFVVGHGKERYRAEQIYKWMYGRNADSFADMTNLAKTLRAYLDDVAYVSRLRIISRQTSQKDRSEKFLFALEDNTQVESVVMPGGQRTTLCLSTQVGCALDCKFCATGMMGLNRNLTAGEIVDQMLTVKQACGTRISNVVLMGMGEPLHNYDNVIKACRLMSDVLGPNLAMRHIVVSTSGLVPRIRQFADEGHKFKLAVSLNATTDAIRSRLMPLNKKWPLASLREAALYYTRKTRQVVTFEYVLLAGINDTSDDATRLKHFAQGIRCKINLIPYNAVYGDFKRPAEANILNFYKLMQDFPAPVTIRWSKGDDIDAGCGQLAARSL
jgi:23S rRNA (adenine2503-C2)-methyltransferase